MKIAVITGSASGIGACIKTRLEAQGYQSNRYRFARARN